MNQILYDKFDKIGITKYDETNDKIVKGTLSDS